MPETSPELVQFFKALADDTRLKIVGLLARESRTGEQLAAILKIKPATVSHHLSKLAEAGLVSASMDGHTRVYELRREVLRATAVRLTEQDTLPQAAAGVDESAYDRAVVRNFLRRDGSLKEIPAQQKKLQAVLRHLVNEFQPGREYTEKEVNETLARFHADTASLRRAMIEYKLMKRASGVYWRVEGATQ